MFLADVPPGRYILRIGAAGLLLLIGAFLLGRRNLKRLALTLRSPSRLYADTPFDLRITLHNRRRWIDVVAPPSRKTLPMA